MEEGRKIVSIAANAVLVRQNWSVGKLIVADEQKGRRKAEYGKKTLEALSARLMLEYGNGYTLTNLKYMRQFYLAFPIGHALRDELGWPHYRILMREGDPIAREWYMNECLSGGWSSRDLNRQVSTDAYHRRLAAANPDRRRKQKELPSGEILRREMKLSLLTKTEIECSQADGRVDFWKVGTFNHNMAVEQSALGPKFRDDATALLEHYGVFDRLAAEQNTPTFN